MKTYFRLYNSDNKADFNSSIFDLINGDNETKQTKGLAYIFSQYNDFLFYFLSLKLISEGIIKETGTKLNIEAVTATEISAERISVENKRADIVIKIDNNKEPTIAIIIEAKTIKKNVNQQDLSAQILNYLKSNQFPDLIGYKKVGIVLTKYKQTVPDVINLSWDIIIQLLFDFCKKRNSNEIISQYKDFITQIDKSMKYYEKEVVSIPAGNSLDQVKKYNIYVCPDTKSYNFKKPLFVTFRQGNGGEMDKLYKIEDIIILNTTTVKNLENSTISEKLKKRICEYIGSENYQDEEKDQRFYLLSETESIELPNKPHPERNNTKFTYYTLKEILTKKIVIPESQQEANFKKNSNILNGKNS